MSRRVVITGMGAITPIGLNVDDFFRSVKEGKHGFGPITRFDAADYKCHVAAQVKDFDAKEFMDARAARRMEPFSQYGMAAAKEAIADAGLQMEGEDPYRVGCAVGSGIGGLQAMEREYDKLTGKGPSRVNPLFIPLMISNMAAGNISIQFGLKGKSLNVVTACATGTNSIGEAFRSIQYGEADVMVAGGTESSITPLGIAGFCALTALSGVDDPDRCSLPFVEARSFKRPIIAFFRCSTRLFSASAFRRMPFNRSEASLERPEISFSCVSSCFCSSVSFFLDSFFSSTSVPMAARRPSRCSSLALTELICSFKSSICPVSC